MWSLADEISFAVYSGASVKVSRTHVESADARAKALAREAAVLARASRDKIADDLEENGDTALAWLYRCTHL